MRSFETDIYILIDNGSYCWYNRDLENLQENLKKKQIYSEHSLRN